MFQLDADWRRERTTEKATMADGELRSQLPPVEIRPMYKTAINWLLSGSSLFGIPFYNWMPFVIAVVLLGIVLAMRRS
jgi:hypothetical protein